MPTRDDRRRDDAATKPPELLAPTRRGAAMLLQTRATVGSATDPQEAEADRVAAEVVGRLHRQVEAERGSGPTLGIADGRAARSGGVIGRRTVSVETTPASRIQRKSSIGAAGGEIDRGTEQQIDALRGRGAALPNPVRRSMEQSFGADFSDVRVHHDAKAQALNVELGAEAFTTGRDIFFRDGLPSGTNSAGQELLAHELTHTIQQGGASSGLSRSIQRKASGTTASLLGATLDTTLRDEGSIKGHNMNFELDLDIPKKAKEKVKGGDRSIARSLYGVSFQWWEEIVEDYNFDEANPALVAGKKAARTGNTYKSWSDIYLANPTSQTFFSWKNSLATADDGGITGNHKTGVLDRPGLNLTANSYKSRTLRFRIEAQDAEGKVFKFDAIQVLKSDDGVLTSSYYHDSSGTDLRAGAGDAEIMKYASTINQAVLRDDVPTFAAKAPGRKAGVRPFADLELDQVMVEVNASSGGSKAMAELSRPGIHKNMQQSNKLNGVPLIPKSDKYLEFDASDGGLLVAHLSGKRIVRMFYTRNAPHTVAVNINGVDKNMNVRGFEQIPTEVFAPPKKRR